MLSAGAAGSGESGFLDVLSTERGLASLHVEPVHPIVILWIVGPAEACAVTGFFEAAGT